MNNYKVDFFRREVKKDSKSGEVISKTYQHVGSVTIDDSGIGSQLTLTSKAFRHASENAQNADRVEIRVLK